MLLSSLSRRLAPVLAAVLLSVSAPAPAGELSSDERVMLDTLYERAIEFLTVGKFSNLCPVGSRIERRQGYGIAEVEASFAVNELTGMMQFKSVGYIHGNLRKLRWNDGKPYVLFSGSAGPRPVRAFLTSYATEEPFAQDFAALKLNDKMVLVCEAPELTEEGIDFQDCLMTKHAIPSIREKFTSTLQRFAKGERIEDPGIFWIIYRAVVYTELTREAGQQPCTDRASCDRIVERFTEYFQIQNYKTFEEFHAKHPAIMKRLVELGINW